MSDAPESPPKDVTQLLTDWSRGDDTASEKLMPIVYGELRRLAGRYLRRERVNHTLQATALVNEAYVRLVGQRDVEWQGRNHFFRAAAQSMRRILVDHARERRAAKRGPDLRISLDEELAAPAPGADLVALDDALKELASFDAQKSLIVELRYFAGLTIEETAKAIGMSPASVKRDWVLARAWLYQNISDQPGE